MGKFRKTICLVVFFYFHIYLGAQILGEHYVYGCENCVVTDFKVIGEYKILFDFTKTSKRKLLLLNEENLLVDEMQVDSPTGLSPLGNNRFSVADFGNAAEVSIVNDKFEVDLLIYYTYGFSELYGLDYILSNKMYNIGVGSYTDNGPHYLSFFPLDQQVKAYYFIGRKHHGYKMKGDTILAISGKEEMNKNLISYKFINGDQSLKDKSSYPVSWIDYAVKGEVVTIFSGHLQALYKVKIQDNKPKMLSTFNLPKKAHTPKGWYYFNDYTAGKDYFLIPAKEGQKNHELMLLGQEDLKKVAELPFIPVDIEDGVVYQLKTGKNSCDIYGYPLEKKEKIKSYDIKND